MSIFIFYLFSSIWAKEYSVTLHTYPWHRSWALSSLNFWSDIIVWWMIMQESASARKLFWFHHPLKYESIEFIMEWAAIHLFDVIQLGTATGFFTTYLSFCTLLHLVLFSLPTSLSLSLSLSTSSFSPTPFPSYHHLSVVLLSWQLKCFLSACWVNWLSQKCILAFTLKYKSAHTQPRTFMPSVKYS